MGSTTEKCPEVSGKPDNYWSDEFAQVFFEELRQVEKRREFFPDREGCRSEPERSKEQSPPDSSATGTVAPGEESATDCRSSDGDISRDLHDLYAEVRGRVRGDGEPAIKGGLVGLAFSGGGIRSATVGLGFLQALAQYELLSKFDYLSSVSGGGYIGSWLAAWIYREGCLKQVEQQLKPGRVDHAARKRLLSEELTVDEEPEPIYHLRAYSSYLSPKLGIASGDSWTLIAIYLRNLFLNAVFWIPALFALVLVARLLMFQFFPRAYQPKNLLWFVLPLLLFAAGLIVLGLCDYTRFNDKTLMQHGNPQRRRPALGLHLLALFPISVASLVGAWLFSPAKFEPGRLRLDQHLDAMQFQIRSVFPGIYPSASADAGWWAWLVGTLYAGLAFGIVFIIVRTISHGLRWIGNHALDRVSPPAPPTISPVPLLLSRLAMGVGFAVLLAALAALARELVQTTPGFSDGLVAVFGPPLLLVALLGALSLQIAFLRRSLLDDEREWWGRISAILLMYAFGWTVVCGLVTYGPLLLLLAGNYGNWHLGGLAIGWLTTGIAGARVGTSRQPRFSGPPTPIFRLVSTVAPPVFLAGLLMLTSLAAMEIIGPIARTNDLAHAFAASLENDNGIAILCWLGVSAGAAVVFSFFIDVNLFSLHELYANRLVRCYLGASRPKVNWLDRDWTSQNRRRTTWLPVIRDWGPGRGGAPTGVTNFNTIDPIPGRSANHITGFDAHDDVPLSVLRPGERNPLNGCLYQGPLLILNTALNLVGGDELAWQERKAESFILSPTYCGSKSTGYRRIDGAHKFMLGRAMAISGAAISPNMGYHSSVPLGALLTLFNVRLGWWLENPNTNRDWTARNPRYFGPLLEELLGRTNETGRFVYLSDGGHFDNLGVYELVRRRCRYIVVCDASADGGYLFEDLASMIRKVRTDFGIRIDIDVDAVRLHEASGRSRWHCAIGRIRYDDVDRRDRPGTLVYVKASLTGDEPTDVLEYAGVCPTFPHESTVDQFFGESQFESYRALGFHMGEQVFEDAGDQARCGTTDALFTAVRRRWFPPPPRLEENFFETTRQFQEIHSRLRTDPMLRDLVDDLFKEIPKGSGGASGAAPAAKDRSRVQAEVNMVAEMLQVMETAWLRMGLTEFSQHPLNRGWMNLFRRWAHSDVFRRYWPALRGQFSREFVRFCKKELKLVVWDIYPAPYRKDAHHGALDQLDSEFRSEWYTEANADRRLKDRITSAAIAGNRPLCWIIWVDPSINDSKQMEPYPVGIVLVTKCPKVGDGDDSGTANCWEEIVWLRGPYRNVEIASDCLNAWVDADEGEPLRADQLPKKSAKRYLRLQDYLREKLAPQPGGSPVILQVRYPSSADTGKEAEYERSMWQHFFFRFGFRHPEKGAEPAQGAVLQTTLKAKKE